MTIETILKRIGLTAVAIVMAFSSTFAAEPRPFFDTGAANRFLETSVHLLGGGSTIIQNYRSTFSAIENINTNMGIMAGVGARATFGIKGFLGLTTEMNIVARNYNLDMSVLGSGITSMSAVYINSRAWIANIPVLMTLRFNVARSVVWLIDVGGYYSYGFAGHQRQRYYVGTINELGQLVGERIDVKSPYFSSGKTFQNSFRRGDIGIHIGTGLNLGPHLTVGARLQIGLKNVSFTQNGVKNPHIHNLDINGMIGWRF